jgi:hypothetical protein
MLGHERSLAGAGLERDGFEIGGGDEARAQALSTWEKLLRHKQLMVTRWCGLQPWLRTAEVRDKVVDVWRAARPVMACLKAHADV